jgi:proteic killer suppression protein
LTFSQRRLTLFAVIRSFRDKGLQRFVEKGDPSKLSVPNHDRVLRLLRRLDAAILPEEMNAPGLFFHALGGDERGRFSIRVTGNWRLTFAFDGEDAGDVDLEDYP